MIGSEETDDLLESSAAGYADDGTSDHANGPGAQHYDPLFNAWPETPQDESQAFDAEDVLWLTSGDWRPSDFAGTSAISYSCSMPGSPMPACLPPSAPPPLSTHEP